MRLRDVMTYEMVTVPVHAPLVEAAELMDRGEVNILPVVEGGRVVGMLVGRDVVDRAIASGSDSTAMEVRAMMIPHVAYGYADQEVAEAARIMHRCKYTELLVFDREHRLVGYVSRDAVTSRADDAAYDRVSQAPMRASAADGAVAYRHIIVALDGSALAERVLPHVALLTRAFGSTLTLLRAVAPSESRLKVPRPEIGAEYSGASTPLTIDPDTLAASERWEGRLYLVDLAERLKGEGMRVTWEQPEGAPAQAIVAAARAGEADLIAMTSHGRGGRTVPPFGSVANAVLHDAPCPLFLLRIDAPVGDRPRVAMEEEGKAHG